MGEYDVKPNEWISSRQIYATPAKKEREPIVDIPLSKALGKKVVMGTPDHRKVVQVIAGWNRKRGDNDTRPVDYLKDEQKVNELKKAIL